MNQSRALRGYLSTILAGLSWGFSGVCGQLLFSHFAVSSLWLTCVRLLCSGVVLSLLALFRKPEQMRQVWCQPSVAVHLVCYGIFAQLLCQYSYLTAISHSNAATATVLQTLNLVLVMLLTCLRLRRFPVRPEAISLLLALFGTFILATGGNPSQMVLSPQGLFWGLISAVGMACYTLMPRKLLERWDRFVVLGYGMLFGGIFISLMARIWTYSVQLPPVGWLAAGAVVLFGTILPSLLIMRGLMDIGPVKTSMLMATEPLSATVISALWLNTAFTAADLVGFSAIILTIFLLAKPTEA